MPRKINPVNRDSRGRVVLDICSTVANDGWLQSARLLAKGTPEALREFKRRDRLEMYVVESGD